MGKIKSQSKSDLQNTFNNIINRLDGVKKQGDGYIAKCPAHDDNTPSLSVKLCDDKILLKCHAGCTFKEICNSLGVDEKTMFANKTENRRSTPILEREHRYVDKNEKEIAVKKIYKNSDGKKSGCWFSYKNGKTQKGLNGVNVPLYRLTKVDNEKETIYFTEGEKDAETVEKMGFTATCLPNKKWNKNYNKYIYDKNIVVLQDNDKAGTENAHTVIKGAFGVAKSVKLINPKEFYPPLKEKGDITDVADIIGEEVTKAKLIEAVEKSNTINTLADLGKQYNDEMFKTILDIKPEINSEWKDADFISLFAETVKKLCRFNDNASKWYAYTGKKWELDNNSLFVLNKAEQFRKSLLSLFDYCYKDNYEAKYDKQGINVLNLIAKLGTESKRQSLVSGAKDRFPIKYADLDKNKDLFNCQNGTLNLKTFAFTEHSPDDMLSKISNVVYDPNAKCERWEQFISEIMQGDESKAEYLQKALGYALSANTELETCFILYGPSTRNGKSTLINTIIDIMGDYALTISPETLAKTKNKDSRSASGDIARLDGARLVNAPEPRRDMLFDEALLKTLLGNDIITARYLHQNEFEFKPIFKLFINTNHLPTVSDTTLFKSGRINIISFERHFEEIEQDKQLKTNLKEEMSGIFNWLLDGYKKYLKYGLNPPKCIADKNKEYELDNDKIVQFFQDRLEFDINSSVTMADAYKSFKEWCAVNGYALMGNRNFKQELIARNLFADKYTVNHKTRTNVIPNYHLK